MSRPQDELHDELQELIIDLVRAHRLVSPVVADGAPLTWLPGVDDPWIKVSEDRVVLSVIAHRWPVTDLLAQLQASIAEVAAPREVQLSCLDVDTGRDGLAAEAD